MTRGPETQQKIFCLCFERAQPYKVTKINRAKDSSIKILNTSLEKQIRLKMVEKFQGGEA